ncbi:hypothetical protein PM082_022283 [Marasmius tenuissimus]|nr:hypothetical protein PM082_022283 [Marasmius tenuissimus]
MFDAGLFAKTLTTLLKDQTLQGDQRSGIGPRHMAGGVTNDDNMEIDGVQEEVDRVSASCIYFRPLTGVIHSTQGPGIPSLTTGQRPILDPYQVNGQ